MDHEKKKNIVIAVLVVINLILLTLVILFATGTISFKENNLDTNHQTNNNDHSLENETNQNQNAEATDNNDENELENNDSFSGIVEVTGYPEIKELTDDIYDNGQKYKYVYFHITEVENDQFQKYLESLKGNAFALDDAIGLGCVIDSKIQYYNESDELGIKEFELSKEDTNKILNATKNKPIKLKLEKLLYTSGKGAQICYSHMTKIEVN